MTHILDNPIWNALNTGSEMFSSRNENCRFVNSEMGFFVGLPSYEEENLEYLHSICSPGQRIILFPPGRITVSKSWKVLNDHELLQMVCNSDPEPKPLDGTLTQLTEKDVPAMLELIELTKPGPFLSRTIDFGGYVGLFHEGKLMSMAGKRLSPDPYVEVSAVCTHPDFGGKGLSNQVMRRVIADIKQAGKIPFLHVYPENTPAIKLYTKLGFEPRASLRTYFLEKIA
jgi:ribosomal protein S18 acetylase RimI-like enzyme